MLILVLPSTDCGGQGNMVASKYALLPILYRPFKGLGAEEPHRLLRAA